jgi:hypothetical protein
MWLLSTLMNLTVETVRQDRSRFGLVLESFVFAELLKHASTAEGEYQLFYYRDHDQLFSGGCRT